MRSRRVGAILKRYRVAARLDQERAAKEVGCSTAKISRIESGASTARVGDVRILLDLYKVTDADVRAQLENLARASHKRGWWLDYAGTVSDVHADLIALETDASYIRSWQPLFIPGLLQTSGYLRSILESGVTVYPDETIEKAVTVRQQRARVIEEGGVSFAAVIWEPVLTCPMPSAKTHREQLTHLVDVAERRNVTIQVLPFSAWAAAHLASHFVMFSFGPEPAPEAVAFDQTTSTVIVEDLEDMAKHARIFEALRSAALTPDVTLDFLRKKIGEITEGEPQLS